MTQTSSSSRVIGMDPLIFARLLLALVVLASMAFAAPPGADAGGARISTSYSLSGGGTIRIQGSRFRDNARIRITLVDRSQGAGYEVTREISARANKRGTFDVTSSGWCPRVVEITARDVSRGTTARDVLENSDCPW